ARAQMVADALKQRRQLAVVDEMVQRVEVCRDKVHLPWQSEPANVLVKQGHVGVAAVGSRHSQHRRRQVHPEYRYAPERVEIASEQPGSASQVGGRRKADPVPRDEMFEDLPNAIEEVAADYIVVRLREQTVGWSEARNRKCKTQASTSH